MSEELQRAAAVATIGLGLSQALTPRAAGRAFGLGDLENDTSVWLARLLGAANVAIGAMGLDPKIREASRAHSLGLLGANATVTAVAAAQGRIPKRTAVSVLGFIGVLLAPGTGRE